MALDKQRILNELNSVVNQLQSADCGCMGKLFSNPGYNNCTMTNPMSAYGGCGHGDSHTCRHNHGAPCTREPQTGMSMDPVNRHCKGRCNPQELYAETYKYLNGNLMQPVVQEVYNDLKSITPANTLSNNPMTSNMGLAKSLNNENLLVQPATGNSTYNAPSEGFLGSTASPNLNKKLHNYQPMGLTAGMGPQIVNMMMGDGSSNPSNVNGKNRQLSGPMVNNPSQSSYGTLGVTPVSFGNANQQQFHTNLDMNIGNGNNGQQYMYSDNNAINSMAQVHPTVRSTEMNNVNTNPVAQQQSTQHHHSHGQHAQGVAKFNQMFPGVMQGVSGDLGFDPMSIAIQMNPANQQKVAIDTLQKVMSGKPLHNAVERVSHSSTIQPNVAGANAAIASIAQGQPNQAISNSTTLGQIAVPGQTRAYVQNLSSTVPNNVLYNEQQPHQVYTSTLSQPIQYPQTIQQIADPNTESVTSTSSLPTLYEGNLERHNFTVESALPQLANIREIKEPIFPADATKNLPTTALKQEIYNEYNTLGQPIELLPANMYHTPEPKLPQTLAPQPVSEKINPMKYSNVKSTVSKTSLIQKTPVSKTSSRSQLQQIYKQYQGSPSYTQQNIKGPGHGASQSEGNLKVIPVNSVNQALIERVGDTAVQNPSINREIPNKVVHAMSHNGDIYVKKSFEDPTQKTLSTKQTTCRNGLQDITYTSYPTSTAWSFHGQNRNVQNPGYYKKIRA